MNQPNQQALYEAFGKALPHIRHSARPADRLAYGRDSWPLLQIRMTVGRVDAMPDWIAWPANTEEVAEIHRFAVAHDIPVIPFGSGSGVCGGAYAHRGGIMMDLKRMNEVLELDPDSRLCRVQAGKNGQLYEEELNRAGFSCGHFPSSIYCSTVGGWVAARGAGQCSTQYGKIEDMVVGATWVKPDGTVRTVDLDDGLAGQAFLDLLIGSEGVLGTLTEVTLRIFPSPASRNLRAFMVDDVRTGIALIRRVLQAGALPSVFRMYDPLDTFLVGREGSEKEEKSGLSRRIGKLVSGRMHAVMEAAERSFLREPARLGKLLPLLSRKCLVVFMVEGDAEKVQWEQSVIQQTARDLGAEDLGDGPAWTWFHHRYHVSYKQSKLYKLGGFVDTMEISAPYERLANIYDHVVETLRPHALVMAHMSHFYRDGGSIYFTFAGLQESAQISEQKYLEIWRLALDAVLRNGGSISHHHGVGLSKAKWMGTALKGALPLSQSIKDSLDPAGTLNPGKLGLV